MRSEVIKLELEVVVTQEDIDDIMAGALEGGINYWCSEAEVVGDYLGEYASEQISRGGVLKLHDLEEDAVYELDKEKLLKGIKMYVKEPDSPHQILRYGDNGEYLLEGGMIDGTVADMIIQYALFGDVIYG